MITESERRSGRYERSCGDHGAIEGGVQDEPEGHSGVVQDNPADGDMVGDREAQGECGACRPIERGIGVVGGAKCEVQGAGIGYTDGGRIVSLLVVIKKGCEVTAR